MNDRELLELAAKAAGLVIGFSKTSPEQGRPYIWNDEKKKGRWWNPLTDDGDALRLAVWLRIDVGAGTDPLGTEVCIASHADKFPGWFEEPYGDNPYAATRRAIVRAAAEIGRQMQEGGAA